MKYFFSLIGAQDFQMNEVGKVSILLVNAGARLVVPTRRQARQAVETGISGVFPVLC
jgi:hypothetical protein